MKKLFKNGYVVSDTEIKKLDVLVNDEIISEVSENIVDSDAEVIDCTDKYLFPGFIDSHTHFDAGTILTRSFDDFSVGSRAEIAGGTTTFIDYATEYSGESIDTALNNWHKKSDGKCYADYAYHMALSEINDKLLNELDVVTKKGIKYFKYYMTYVNKLSDEDAYKFVQKLHSLGGVTAVHCECDDILKSSLEKVKNKYGLSNPKYFPKTRPNISESVAIKKVLDMVYELSAPIIIAHLSTKEGLDEIRKARKRGQKVIVETCPHYLTLDESVFDSDSNIVRRYICCPPIRTKEDSDALWNAIKNKEIQTIVTDHCAFSIEQKELGKDDFTKTPYGLPGAEDRPIIIYNEGVLKEKITLEEMTALLSTNVAKIYDLYPRKGVIAKGADADISIFDKDIEWVIEGTNGQSKSGYSCYDGKKVKGKFIKVYLRGNLMYDNGIIVGSKIGKYLR